MMRTQRFIIGLLSSYAAIGVNILYTLASVPLALHYLSKEEFGLWALVTQISGYLMLLELGMSGSVARSLSDHKDHIETGVYGSILRTGSRIFAFQGCAVVLVGVITAWAAPPLLALPVKLYSSFTILMALQAVFAGFRLAMSALGSPLWCHQRLDISNLASSISLIISLCVLWLGFHLGWHLYSIVAATAATSASNIGIMYLSCRKLNLYPPREYRGKYDAVIFKELFHFGGGLFLMNLGAQLASASQIIVVSRFMGIEAAAIWAIASKVFSMSQQFVLRIMDSSAGGLAEMIVRKESAQLQKRFRDIVFVTAVMAITCSAGIALMNGPFIELWTSGEVTWKPLNNYLLACILFTTTITRCHVSLTGITQQIHGMKYIYLAEGIFFILSSIWLVQWLGLSGMLIAAFLCNLSITGIYGNWRTSLYFKIPFTEPIRWIARPFGVLIIISGLFLINNSDILSDKPPILLMITGGSIFCIIVIPMIWILGLTPDLRTEIHKIISRMLEKIISIFRHI